MDCCFKKNIYPIALLLLVFFYGCHSLPPSTPAGPGEQYFEPGVGLWEKTTMPADLLGDWYRGGKLELTVGEDTMRVSGIWSLIQSVEKSDSYYRIIHMIEAQYYATYFLNLTEESVEVVEAKGYAEDEEGAAVLTEIESRHTMTSASLWTATQMPEEMPGNWHINDGNMEMSIDWQSFILDRESWEIEATQTNYKIDRIILKRSGSFKTFYFKNVSTYSMDAFLIDGREDIQDRYGKVPGEWDTIYRWWDFIEQHLMYQGFRWTYNCQHWEEDIQVYNTSSPIDSIEQTNTFEGQLELEVTTSTISDGNGSLSLQATFRIDKEEGRYYHALKDSVIQVLTDSSWSNTSIIKTEQYGIFLENDTLWFDTEQGKVFFCSRKFRPNALINLRPFVYPFTFPREDFPEGRDIIAKIHFFQEGQYTTYQSEQITPYFLTEGYTIIWGGVLTKGAVFESGKGFRTIYYEYENNDMRYWFGDEQKFNPYKKRSWIYCSLTGFTPGQ